MIETIQAIDPSLEIQTLGPSQTIIEVIYEKKKVSLSALLRYGYYFSLVQ